MIKMEGKNENERDRIRMKERYVKKWECGRMRMIQRECERER